VAPQPHNADPSCDPLIFAIEIGSPIGPEELELAIAYRLTLLDQTRREISTLEKKRAHLLGADPRAVRTEAG
jgi:hypothetical protein